VTVSGKKDGLPFRGMGKKKGNSMGKGNHQLDKKRESLFHHREERHKILQSFWLVATPLGGFVTSGGPRVLSSEEKRPMQPRERGPRDIRGGSVREGRALISKKDEILRTWKPLLVFEEKNETR